MEPNTPQNEISEIAALLNAVGANKAEREAAFDGADFNYETIQDMIRAVKVYYAWKYEQYIEDPAEEAVLFGSIVALLYHEFWSAQQGDGKL
jgi:hypothetical protein